MTGHDNPSLLIKGGHLIDPAANAQFRRYVFENAKKDPRNPRASVEKKLPESAR